MVRFKVIGPVLLACALVGFEFHRFTHETKMQDNSAEMKSLKDKLAQLKAKEEADEKLGQYAINMMYKSSNTVKNLSPARMQVLARSIVRVSNDIFDNEQHKQAFIGVLQIESQFLRFAQSPTGPKGLAQLTRNTFHSALGTCGVKDLKDDDVWETDLNLYAGACYFKDQLIREKGNVVAAMVDYNQGPDSEDAKMFRKSGDLKNLEPAKYLSKYSFNDLTTTNAVTPNVPAIQTLPKPVTSKATSESKASTQKTK